jgi:hypothetical protein
VAEDAATAPAAEASATAGTGATPAPSPAGVRMDGPISPDADAAPDAGLSG